MRAALLLVALVALVSGCDQGRCLRHSDCPAGQSCMNGLCQLPDGAVVPTDLGADDVGLDGDVGPVDIGVLADGGSADMGMPDMGPPPDHGAPDAGWDPEPLDDPPTDPPDED